MTQQAFICDAIRTPFGRYGGALSSIRTDDLGAIPLRALMQRNAKVDWQAVTDVLYGNANQAGEDNRNVAHMASLLAGLPIDVPGATINRLCGSGLDAVGSAARAIKAGEATLMIAGGVESMSRAPFVMPKAESAFSRTNAIYDTTIGWRFVNKLMKEKYGVDSMPETAENVATDFKIEREAQDRMALASQLKAVAAQKAGFFDSEIVPGHHPAEEGRGHRGGQGRTPARDLDGGAGQAQGRGAARRHRHRRQCQRRERRRLRAAAGRRGHRRRNGLTPRARVVGMATAGVPPRIMGIGPAPATQKVLALTGLKLEQMDVIELNEAFAAQGLAVLRSWACATTTRASTRTAAPSRWATRSAPRARGWPSRPSTSCTAPAAATRCAPCASASARASRSSSSGCDCGLDPLQLRPRGTDLRPPEN
jgi:acetyl-CoA acyltransferase